MRIDVVNDKVVCIADDWKSLTRDEHNYLSKCAWNMIWEGFTADGHLKLGNRVSNESYKTALSTICIFAEMFNIEVSERVYELKESYEKTVAEERERRRKQEEAEERVKLWEIMKKNGCGNCKDLKRHAEDGFKCMFSCDELQAMLYDEYNPITRVYEMFHQTGVPNEHCKYFVKTEIK